MELELGKFYPVRIFKIIKAGALVKIEGSEDTELIHLSNISDKYVEKVEDFVKVGDLYEAVAIKGKAHPIELSLRHVNSAKHAQDYVHGKKVNNPHPHSASKRKSPKPTTSTKTLDDMIEESTHQFNSKFGNRYAYRYNGGRNSKPKRRRK